MESVSTVSGRASRWAKFFNSMIRGPLSRLIKAGPGIVVTAHGNDKGVTISTSASTFGCFKLQENRDSTNPIAALPAGDENTTPDSDAVEHDVYLTFTPDFYFEDAVVRCERVKGQWEIISPGVNFVSGDISADVLQDGTATLTVDGGGSISVLFELFSATTDENPIYANWNPLTRQWLATGKRCEHEDDSDNADGGNAAGGGDTEDGGTPSTPSGDLDGGTP